MAPHKLPGGKDGLALYRHASCKAWHGAVVEPAEGEDDTPA